METDDDRGAGSEPKTPLTTVTLLAATHARAKAQAQKTGLKVPVLYALAIDHLISCPESPQETPDANHPQPEQEQDHAPEVAPLLVRLTASDRADLRTLKTLFGGTYTAHIRAALAQYVATIRER